MLKNGEDLGKLIVAKGFKKLPKVQNIAQSGHTGGDAPTRFFSNRVVRFGRRVRSKMLKLERGGGSDLVVSLLTLYSNELSSNPAKINSRE